MKPSMTYSGSLLKRDRVAAADADAGGAAWLAAALGDGYARHRTLQEVVEADFGLAEGCFVDSGYRSRHIAATLGAIADDDDIIQLRVDARNFSSAWS
jgi:hypothetical protein